MRIVGTFTALALLTLSACANEKGAVLPSATSTPSATSASPTPTAVGGRAGVPNKAKKHTRAGAEAFARYYFEMVNLAWRTPDPSVLDGLGTAGCEICRTTVKKAERLQRSGRHFATDPNVVKSVSPHPGAPTNREYFKIRFIQPGATIIDSDGKRVDSDPKRDMTVYGATVWQGGQWYFAGLQRLPA